MSKRLNILPTRASFFISSAGKIESVREFKTNFYSTNDSHIKIMCSYIVVFNVQAILYFLRQFSFINCFDLFNYSNKTGMQISKCSFALVKFKN